MSRTADSRARTAEMAARFLRKRDKHELLAWLKGSEPGSYRYISEWTIEQSLAWTVKLYAAGAVELWAFDFKRNAGYESFEWLLIVLPVNSAKRLKVFNIANAQIESEGFEPEEDYDQQHLLVWFD